MPLRSSESGRCLQSSQEPQNLLEQFPRHLDLGRLEDDVAAMAHDLGADVDHSLPWHRERCMYVSSWHIRPLRGLTHCPE
jgi:hypothetical protein